MSRGIIINNPGAVETVVNLSTIRALDGDTIYTGSVYLSDISEDEIDAVKSAVEAYSGGGPDHYEEGYADGKAAIVTLQKPTLNDYQTKLNGLISPADIDTNEGQKSVIDSSYQYLKTPSEISAIESAAANEARHTIVVDHQPIAEEYQTKLPGVADIQSQDPTDLIGQRNIFNLAADYLSEGGSEGWHSSNPLCFTAEQANSTVKSANNRLVKPEISYDGVNWSTYTEGTTITLTNIGDKVYFRSKMVGYNNSTAFGMSGKISASGNPESLFEAANGMLFPYCYSYMFNGCTSLTTAPELPATELATYCYSYMFKNCTSLTTAPELPATKLATYCYGYMFQNCTSLTTAPELPATVLANSCYSYMFNGCTSLTTAPELPATTLSVSCYGYMFQNCTSLTTAPELPATVLAGSCYSYMFNGCTSLTTAPELPATELATYCYSYMFKNCTSLTTAPELPATVLAGSCYSSMFRDCSSLSYIKVGAPAWNTSYTTNWVSGVSSTGTFVKPTATSIVTGVAGIPSGWTVENY